MQNRRWFLILILAGALIAACSVLAPGQESPAQETGQQDPAAGGDETAGGGETAGGEGTAGNTDSPTPDVPQSATEEPEPLIEAQFALMQRSCASEDRTQWCLLENGSMRAVTPPAGSINFFEFAPRTASILYGSAFPDHGGGPGNKAVSDLWIMDLQTGAMQPVVTDEIVVIAHWAPNGIDFAYVRALPDTYELVWHSGGVETVLATDAHFVFDISSGGDRIAFTREPDMGVGPGMGLYAVDIAGGTEHFLSEIDREGGGSIADQPHWSADDRAILLPMLRQEGNIATLVATSDGSSHTDLTFSPDVAPGLRSFPLPNEQLWYPDSTRMLVQIYTGNMMEEGQWLLVRYSFNAELTQITSAEIAAEDVMMLGWETPGSTVWLQPADIPEGTPFLLALP